MIINNENNRKKKFLYNKNNELLEIFNLLNLFENYTVFYKKFSKQKKLKITKYEKEKDNIKYLRGTFTYDIPNILINKPFAYFTKGSLMLHKNSIKKNYINSTYYNNDNQLFCRDVSK
jgi:hypothetical protein